MTMELEFERDTIVCYETLTEVTLCQEETLESIVPDACPDILRIVDVCGQATLSSKAAKEGMAVVTGMVRAVILYQPEGSAGLRRMEVGLPFTCQAEATGLTDQGLSLIHISHPRWKGQFQSPARSIRLISLPPNFL